jgi:hypothetical protein
LVGSLAAVAIALSPATALAGDSDNIGVDLGLGVASALCSIVYAPVKIIYASGGLIVGGFGWALSGGDSEVASAIVDPAVRGDYVVTPAVLKGERPLEFYGHRRAKASSGESMAATPDW